MKEERAGEWVFARVARAEKALTIDVHLKTAPLSSYAAGIVEPFVVVKSAIAIPAPVPLRVFQTREQTRAFYNKISKVYDLLSERSEAPMRRTGLELLKPAKGETILEIGFGTGHSLLDLARAVGRGGSVLGLDLSDEMVKAAKENLRRAGLLNRAKVRRGDATAMPYANTSVDAIFMSFTLELFDTPEIPKVLAECKRVLRPHGRIVVVGMSKRGSREPLVPVFEWAHKHFPNFIDCRPIYVEQALRAAGFNIRKALIKHMWIPVEIVLGTNHKPDSRS